MSPVVVTENVVISFYVLDFRSTVSAEEYVLRVDGTQQNNLQNLKSALGMRPLHLCVPYVRTLSMSICTMDAMRAPHPLNAMVQHTST